jgi:hypothetical protein
MHISTYFINTLLKKHFKRFCDEILVSILLFLDEILKHSKVLLNRVKVRQVQR